MPGSVRNAASRRPRSTRHTIIAFVLSVHDSFFASDSTTEYGKQPRQEGVGRRREGIKNLRSKSITTTLAESTTKQSTFSELAERLRNFHESANALAVCSHAGDITSQTDPNMIEAAKHLCHKLLRKASENMEHVPPRSCECQLAEVERDKRRCPRHWTSKEKSCFDPGS